MILRKLEYLLDIRFMLATTDMNRAFVDAEVAPLGLEGKWRKCSPSKR